MVSDICLRTILIVRMETRCRHIGYSFRLAAMVLLYAPSHRQDSTYHGLCYTIVEHWLEREIAQWVHPMKDRSDDPSHHERTLLPRSYISLPDCGVWKRQTCSVMLSRLEVASSYTIIGGSFRMVRAMATLCFSPPCNTKSLLTCIIQWSFYNIKSDVHFIYGYMEGRKEMFYLTTHSTHFIYGYMVSDIW